MTSLAELERWMAMPREGETLEFKEAKNQYDLVKLFRYCVAIANEGGGKLILGVSNPIPRRVVGSRAFLDLHDVQTKILDKLRFRVDTEEISHPDGRVVVFHIPSRPRGTAYQQDGAYLMRSTEDTVAMSEDKLRQIFSEGKPDWLAEYARIDCTAANVIELLDTQGYFDLMKLPYPATRDGVLERLESEKLIAPYDDRWAIANLGAILFAKRLDEFGSLARKAPRVIRYEGSSKLKTRLDQFGKKGYAVGFQGLIEFIGGLTPRNEVIEKALRREVRAFPDIAVRELIANALIHQDFNETGTSVAIEIYDDRLEVSNPGLPFIAPERFIDEYQSRNERLADLMRRLGACEEKGSGIDKVVNAAEVFQLPAPSFRAGDRRTTTVVYGPRPFERMGREDRVRACYQHCCLRYVMNQKATNQTLRERFGLPEARAETVSRIIRDAVAAQRIKPEDPESTSKRYARYIPFWA